MVAVDFSLIVLDPRNVHIKYELCTLYRYNTIQATLTFTDRCSNTQTDLQADRQTDEQSDRPYKMCRLAFDIVMKIGLIFEQVQPEIITANNTLI